MSSHAVISKSRSKKNPFKVSYIGVNGEIVATSELLTTKWNCKKNIKAMINMVNNAGGIPEKINNMLVVDRTGKKEVKFEMMASGYEKKLVS
jgi:uncharacterized protein YegP (UPF0339 family)